MPLSESLAICRKRAKDSDSGILSAHGLLLFCRGFGQGRATSWLKRLVQLATASWMEIASKAKSAERPSTSVVTTARRGGGKRVAPRQLRGRGKAFAGGLFRTVIIAS